MLQTDFFLIKGEADEKQGGVLRHNTHIENLINLPWWQEPIRGKSKQKQLTKRTDEV